MRTFTAPTSGTARPCPTAPPSVLLTGSDPRNCHWEKEGLQPGNQGKWASIKTDSSPPSGRKSPPPQPPTNMDGCLRLSPSRRPPAPITPLSLYPPPSALGGQFRVINMLWSVCPVNISTLRTRNWPVSHTWKKPYDNNGLNSGQWRGEPGVCPPQPATWSARRRVLSLSPWEAPSQIWDPWCRAKALKQPEGEWSCQG